MAAELTDCPVVIDGIGNDKCITEPILKFVNGFIPALESQQFDTRADFEDETVNKEQIASGDLLPLKIMQEMENSSTEQLTSETSSGTKLFHREGRYGFIGSMLLSPDQNRILQSYDGRIRKGYIMDDSGNRLGTTPDGTVITGLTVSYFKVMPMDLPFAPDGSSWSKIEVQFEFEDEINIQPAYSIASSLSPAWIPKKVIKPSTKIIIVPGVMTPNTFIASFNYVDPTTGRSVAVTGLSAAGDELTLIDQAGDVVPAITVVAVVGTPGDYTITDTGAVMISGTIKLNATADVLIYSDTTVVSDS